MRIYVATKFENALAAKALMTRLEALGHTITHDWTKESAAGKTGVELEKYLCTCALRDVEGVRSCELLVLLNHPHGKGMFTELGMAIAFKTSILIVQPELASNIFFHLDQCEWAATVDDAVEFIERWGQ